MTEQTTDLLLEDAVWNTGSEWSEALAALIKRFARAKPVPVDQLEQANAVGDQITVLSEWAETAKVDLDREIGRWLDEHLAMHIRPNPQVTRAVRSLAATSQIHLWSALPSRSAEAIARHCGIWRSVTKLHQIGSTNSEPTMVPPANTISSQAQLLEASATTT